LKVGSAQAAKASRPVAKKRLRIIRGAPV